MAHPLVKKIAGTALIAYLAIRIINGVARSMQKSTNATVAKIGNVITG